VNVEKRAHQVIVVVMVNQVRWDQLVQRVMLAILDNQAHPVALAQWVILVHQALHFQVKEVKRVFQVQSVSLAHQVRPV